ncbi:peptidylprolyl isomerase [Croceibacter atlanticus]|jgi:peptidyl-prolyl cis-trans isomerase SurA|uniref:peptidylprolyl isomerase n=1 Tax=Croceibacter atlanticus TaxID=313588 RepID=UPI0024BA2535|nr:peptidylprolyl isomerase [Croceibacter atlanticus]
MQLKIMNLRFSTKYLTVAALIGATVSLTAQETTSDSTAVQTKQVIVTESSTAITETAAVQDTVKKPFKKFKVDGVAAVVGEYVVLDSDIDKAYIELKSQGISVQDITRCNLTGKLLEDKLYAHHAVIDSIMVNDAEVNAYVDQQIDYMKRQLGTMEKVLNFYQKDNEGEFRAELFEINKQNKLAGEMQRSIVDGIEITPEEVREYFNGIPKEDRPLFGDEIEIAQIIIQPEIPQAERQRVIDRLNEMRRDVLDNGASFATKAVLYSQDTGSRANGGQYSLTRKDPFVKEFKDAAFSLQEGEISEPFETEFGFHILMVDKIRGQTVDVRQVLLVPDTTLESVNAARKQIDSLKTEINKGTITFEDAAVQFSTEEETKQDGGQLINPATGDTRFELTKIDPTIYNQVVNLDENEISPILTEEDRVGRKKFKIMTVTDRYEEHIADYAQDYLKIKELALKEKQLKAIEAWQEEKIDDTYIKINGDYRNCDFASDWLKQN